MNWLEKGSNEGVMDDVLRRNQIFQLFGMLGLWFLRHNPNTIVLVKIRRHVDVAVEFIAT